MKCINNGCVVTNYKYETINVEKVIIIIITMVAISFMTFVIGGITISSVAIATFVGMIMNAIIRGR